MEVGVTNSSSLNIQQFYSDVFVSCLQIRICFCAKQQFVDILVFFLFPVDFDNICGLSNHRNSFNFLFLIRNADNVTHSKLIFDIILNNIQNFETFHRSCHWAFYRIVTKFIRVMIFDKYLPLLFKVFVHSW